MGVFSGSGGMKPPVAGAGSEIDPKKPVNRYASGYQVEEKVNAGPSGGKKGKVAAFHGQNSDGSGEKDDLVPQTSEQKDPYHAKPSEFPVKAVNARTGQSGAYGLSSGYNELATYGANQEGPRYAEDDGPGEYGSGTPVPGNRGARVASGFIIEVNKGESNSDTGEIGIMESVNLQTGHIEGGSGGVVQYVPEEKVSVGAPPSRNMKAGRRN